MNPLHAEPIPYTEILGPPPDMRSLVWVLSGPVS